jgi:leucyl-tRNA synthetase
LWNLVQEYLAVAEGGNMDSAVAKKIERASHHMIQKMTHDIEQSTYNTAIATAMGTLNELYKLKSEIAKHPAWQHALESLVACVAPFAPHITEELWSRLGRETSVHIDSWPEWDADKLTADMLTVVIQINGKLRGELPLAPDMPEAAVVQAARTHKKIAPYLDGKEIRKTVYIPGRIVNFVV